MDADWTFKLADSAAFAGIDYNDAHWRRLDLPHDWSIEGKIDKKNASGWRGGFFPGGVGWYRKRLTVPGEWKGKKVTLVFDGVYMNSTVYLNGHRVGYRPYGYSTFVCDLSPHLQPGENVLAVRVDNTKQPSSRWYTGCGIYRHVWLKIDRLLHIEHDGIFITTPVISPDTCRVLIQTTVQNVRNTVQNFQLQ